MTTPYEPQNPYQSGPYQPPAVPGQSGYGAGDQAPYGQPAYQTGETAPYGQPPYNTGETAPYGQMGQYPPPDQYQPPGTYPPPTGYPAQPPSGQGGYPPPPPGYQPPMVGSPAPGGKPPSGGKGPIIALIVGAAVVLIGVVVAVLFLTGVLGGKDDKKAVQTTTSATPKATQTEAPPTPTPTDSPIEPTDEPTYPTDRPGGFSETDVFYFGQTAVWDDGMEVWVGEPSEYTPDDTNAGFSGTGIAVRFTVTVYNNSAYNFEPIDLYVEAMSANQAGERIFDVANGIDLPTDPVLPGESLTWDIAFEVVDPADMAVAVAPGWDYNTVYFEY